MTSDPILDQRARYQRAVTLGLRLGYGLYALAIALFILGFAWRFEGWIATGIIVCVVVGSVILAPAIVFSYAVRAAERHDREIGL